MTAKDPVFGMEAESPAAAPKDDYKGQTYYFCSEHCRMRFREARERYANRAARAMVAIEFLPEKPGEYEFACQMGMFRGRLIVE